MMDDIQKELDEVRTKTAIKRARWKERQKKIENVSRTAQANTDPALLLRTSVSLEYKPAGFLRHESYDVWVQLKQLGLGLGGVSWDVLKSRHMKFKTQGEADACFDKLKDELKLIEWKKGEP